jgi:hypothetical protein
MIPQSDRSDAVLGSPGFDVLTLGCRLSERTSLPEVRSRILDTLPTHPSMPDGARDRGISKQAPPTCGQRRRQTMRQAFGIPEVPP